MRGGTLAVPGPILCADAAGDHGPGAQRRSSEAGRQGQGGAPEGGPDPLIPALRPAQRGAVPGLRPVQVPAWGWGRGAAAAAPSSAGQAPPAPARLAPDAPCRAPSRLRVPGAARPFFSPLRRLRAKDAPAPCLRAPPCLRGAVAPGLRSRGGRASGVSNSPSTGCSREHSASVGPGVAPSQPATRPGACAGRREPREPGASAHPCIAWNCRTVSLQSPGGRRPCPRPHQRQVSLPDFRVRLWSSTLAWTPGQASWVLTDLSCSPQLMPPSPNLTGW